MDSPATRDFFQVGRKFRVSQFLATSFDRTVATGFMVRAKTGGPVNARVLWRVDLDSDLGCDHVNFVSETHVPGEFEFLFAAFSAFTVVAARWDLLSTPPQHEIRIRAAVDNTDAAFPENLDLAPWC